MSDELSRHDRLYLDKLRLAAEVLLEASEEPGSLPDPLVAELFLFKDRIEHALLSR